MMLRDEHWRRIQAEVDRPREWQRVNFGRDWI